MDDQVQDLVDELTAAHLLLEGLLDVGIDYVFANLGTDHAPIIEEMARWKRGNKSPPQFILCPHENTAAHMAGGYALATGRGQAVLVHVDAGTANSVMAMHNMLRSRLPLMLMAGRAPFTSHGELLGTRDNYVHFIQEPNDQGSLVRPYVKWEYTLPSAVTTKEVIYRAHSIMQSDPKGPVYLMLPREILAGKTRANDVRDPAPEKHGAMAAGGAEPSLVAALGRRLLAAKKPILITSYGGMTEGTSEAIDRLSRLAGMRVYEANMVANISHEMECFCGFNAEKSLGTTDFGMIVDSDVPWMPAQTAPIPDSFWVHIDVDALKPATPIWSFPADQRVQGNSAIILEQLTGYVEREANSDFQRAAVTRLEAIREERQALKKRAVELAADKGQLGAINPHYILAELGKLLLPDDIIIHEAVRNQPAMVLQIPRHRAKTMVRTGGGGLGSSGGMALGVKLAKPDTTVVQIVGDGSYYYNNPASTLAVSKQHALPILTIILDNGGWSAVKQSTLNVYPAGYAMQSGLFESDLVGGVEFSRMADIFGFKGVKLENPDDVAQTLSEALASVRSGKTTIVHVRVPHH